MGDYLTTILADSPDIVWPLDETSGTAATDASGNGNDGTYSGSYTLDDTELILGSPAPLFNGTGKVASDSPLTIPAPFTLEAWVEQQDVALGALVTICPLFGWWSNATNNAELFQDATGGGVSSTLNGPLSGQVADGTVSVRVNGNEIAQPSAYDPHHYALVVDLGSVSFYVDGELWDVAIVDMSAAQINGTLTVGDDGRANAETRAWIAWVAAYPSALSGERVLAHYLAADRDWPASDTATLTDTAVLTRTQQAVDAGIATDSASRAVSLTDTDSGTGVETWSRATSFRVTETGVASDLPTANPSNPRITDTGRLSTERATLLTAVGPTGQPSDVLFLPAPGDFTPTVAQSDILFLPAPSDVEFQDG